MRRPERDETEMGKNAWYSVETYPRVNSYIKNTDFFHVHFPAMFDDTAKPKDPMDPMDPPVFISLWFGS